MQFEDDPAQFDIVGDALFSAVVELTSRSRHGSLTCQVEGLVFPIWRRF